MAGQQWTILGVGAIGGLWAAHLHAAGADVRLCLRDQGQLERYRRQGGLVLQPDFEQRLVIPAVSLDGLKTEEPIEQLLLCTKSWQTLTAIESLPDRQQIATAILLQNGLGVIEQIQPLLPNAQITQASTTEGAYRSADFDIVRAGIGETTFDAAAGPALEPLLSTALKARRSDNIEESLWLKLCMNCAINLLCALNNCSNGYLLEDEALRLQLFALISELRLLSRAAGFLALAGELTDKIPAVIRATANNQCSMLTDLNARQPTERAAISGYALQRASTLGLQLPVLSTLDAEIHRRETLRL